MSLFEGRDVGDSVNLTIGAPGQDILEQANDLFKQSVENGDNEKLMVEAFQYGACEGSAYFRNQLAAFLTSQYGDSVDASNLLLTCGASQGLHLLISKLMDLRNGVVFVEDPTYFLALDIFSGDFGLNVIPTDFQNDFESKILEAKSKLKDVEYERYWALVYIIPIFHNPTGRCMPEKTCKFIIEMAKKHNLLVVCDDVYNLLWYNQDNYAPKRLLEYDKTCSNLIMNASFSKIVAPGLRLGWIEASPDTIKELSSSGLLNSGGACNSVMSAIIATAMHKGLLQSHLLSLRNK